jgi:hypothetical protein
VAATRHGAGVSQILVGVGSVDAPHLRTRETEAAIVPIPDTKKQYRLEENIGAAEIERAASTIDGVLAADVPGSTTCIVRYDPDRG